MLWCTRLNTSLPCLTDTQTPPTPLAFVPLLLWLPSQSPIQGPMDPSDLPLLDRLSDSPAPLSYLEPDLAETNPTAFAQKLQVCREKPTSQLYLLPWTFAAVCVWWWCVCVCVWSLSVCVCVCVVCVCVCCTSSQDGDWVLLSSVCAFLISIIIIILSVSFSLLLYNVCHRQTFPRREREREREKERETGAGDISEAMTVIMGCIFQSTLVLMWNIATSLENDGLMFAAASLKESVCLLTVRYFRKSLTLERHEVFHNISGGQSTQIKYLSKSTDTYSKILLQ